MSFRTVSFNSIIKAYDSKKVGDFGFRTVSFEAITNV